MAEAADKRVRLVEAAGEVVHAGGYHRASLAQIAAQAEVPLGNVYYYFRRKADIGEAVVDRLAAGQEGLRHEWSRLADPRERLAAFLSMPKRDRQVLARWGCPLGTLGAELGKDGGPLAERVAAVLADWLAWLREQFAELQRPDPGADAAHVLAAVQGASLLAHVLNKPSLVAKEAERLQAWVRSL